MKLYGADERIYNLEEIIFIIYEQMKYLNIWTKFKIFDKKITILYH